MKTQYALALTLLTGVAIGAVAVQGLHAQAKPPVYQVSLIDVKNADAYAKDYVPTVRAAIKAGGGRAIAASAKVTPIEGDAPKSRVAITQWDSVEQYQAYRNTAAFKDARKIGDQYATFNSFLVEGVPQ
jgi:uncharacterized protein (DUF1330 family)